MMDQLYRVINEIQEQRELSLRRQLKFMRAQAKDAARGRLERMRRRLVEGVSA